MTAFRDFLTNRWRELGLTQAEFCRRVGSPAGWVQQIREGKRTMPPDRVELWSNKLELTGRARQHFSDLAATTHLPAAMLPRFEHLVAVTHA